MVGVGVRSGRCDGDRGAVAGGGDGEEVRVGVKLSHG